MSRTLFRLLVCAVAALVAGCGTAKRVVVQQPPTPTIMHLDSTSFAAFDGWAGADARPALAAFLRSCNALMSQSYDASLGGMGYAGKIADWRSVCDGAARVPNGDAAAAHAFFEASFIPYAVAAEPPSAGLFTGYYEPLLRGSRLQHDQYQTPLYALPPGYEIPHAARADIVANGTSLPVLCYVDDKIDAFFLQIQGSGRVQLDDGTVIRAAYGGQNGYPYTAVGAVLLGRGEIPKEQMSMQAIRAWMLAHPDQADALMNMDESYIFFVEKPVMNPTEGAEGSQHSALEPTASIAVDRSIHPLGVPVWIETMSPAMGSVDLVPMHRLYVAQDTGGAIKGPVRADIYWGFGLEATELAGRMKSEGRMSVLLPVAVASRLGPHAQFRL